VFGAIHDGAPDQALLSYQYLQMLPQLAQGNANKVWVIPSEFSQALGGLAQRFTNGPPPPPAPPKPRPSHSTAEIDAKAQADAEAAARAAREATEAAESSMNPGGAPPPPPPAA
jgi:regulator of protease activity HflC (stomatin/prohibitin superfamily)